MSRDANFPDWIKNLPKGDYSGDGAGDIEGYILQGERNQVVFNENEEYVEFTPHKHAASFGVVLAGWCELVIEGVTSRYETGETYRVPADTEHFARQSAGYKDIVIFDESDRVPYAK